MPEVSRFYGIVIQIYYGDHQPPHFHALYAGHVIKVAIETREIIDGSLPKRALALVDDWADLHRQELLEAFNRAASLQPPGKIAPLEWHSPSMSRLNYSNARWRSWPSVVYSLAAVLLNAAVFADAPYVESLTVEPAEITLTDADQSVQYLVTIKMNDGTLRDGTRQAQYSLSQPSGSPSAIANLDEGRLVPRADGTVTVTASVTDPVTKKPVSARATATVKNFAVERDLHFVNDIEPVLTKTGCNSGGCHGKASGQNGFRLSLFAFEPKFDYDALVNEAHGRRVFPASPEESLLLTKATGRTVHGGGSRFDEQSDAYKLLARWIAQGVPYGDEKAPTIARIEVLPRERMLAGVNGLGEQQLRVIAHYTDGAAHDVTCQAEYKAQQPDILKVEPTGLVTTLGHTGEGAVMVRYMGQVDVARVAVPFGPALPDSAYAGFQPKNFVDELVAAKWRKLAIAPSAESTDAEFIRRASIDAIGTIPSPEEVEKFLADPAPNKRDLLVDRLLERPEYASYWSQQWGDLLRVKRGGQFKAGTFAFSGWLRTAFAQNMPYDQFVRAILTAQGESAENPPINWYRHVRNTVAMVNDSSQLFMGTRLSCANCHNHPYERITQDDYWGYGAFFARVSFKRGLGDEQSVVVKKDGGVNQPRTGQLMKPKGLFGPEYDYVRGEDPRQKLADWLAEPTNPFFSKSIANRLWAHFMGVGLVESVDDMRVTNPPSNPELLDRLAKEMVDYQFDQKHLMATILKSRAYSLSSEPTEQNKADRQNYARYTPHRLSAESLLDAVDKVTGTQEKFDGLPLGTRAIELPDESTPSYFLKVFGRSMRESACECEKSYAPNLSQILHLMNSPELQAKISNDKSRLAVMIKEKKTDEEILHEFYLRAFGREPRADEMKDALAMLEGQDRKSALEDFEWMFLNSKEFLFNH